MADISKCRGDGCPIKETCYRYKAKSNEFWQAYFSLVPYKNGTGCDHYWEMHEQKGKHERVG